MSTPERPSLADTLARIDAVLADLKKTTAAEAARLDGAVFGPSLPPMLVCPTCGKPGRSRTARDVGPDPKCVDCLLVRKAVVAAIAHGDVHQAARQSATQLAAAAERPPDPDWVTFEPLSKPGWLARTLRRLFT